MWYFQPSPHDTHDWDATQTPVLFDGEFNGAKRKLLAQAACNGYFFVLDRTNGQHLLTKPFIETNWASGIDERGRPMRGSEERPGARWHAGFSEFERRNKLAASELQPRYRLVLCQRGKVVQCLLSWHFPSRAISLPLKARDGAASRCGL
jgi:hypothetical protein